MESKLSFSFGHSDWLTLHYLLGNAKCLQELIKEYFLKDCQFLGSSWGALVATCMALDLDVNQLSTVLEKISLSSQR
jgi:pimeloyl-ACP methyl ester carboxylesterase